MFSRLAIPAARLAVRTAAPRASPLVAARPSPVGPSRSPLAAVAARFYAGGAPGAPDRSLSKANVEARILDIFQGFDKVKQDKVRSSRRAGLAEGGDGVAERSVVREPICSGDDWLTPSCLYFLAVILSQLSLDASFTEDLGLDSLDAVEVIMAIEEDFFIEVRFASRAWPSLASPAEFVSCLSIRKLTRLALLLRLPICVSQIPDAEADEIRTVRQGEQRRPIGSGLDWNLALTPPPLFFPLAAVDYILRVRRRALRDHTLSFCSSPADADS